MILTTDCLYSKVCQWNNMAMVALAKPSVNAKNKPSGINLPFFCPSPYSFIHAFPFISIPPFFTCLTLSTEITFHVVIKSAAHQPDREMSEHRQINNVNISLC